MKTSPAPTCRPLSALVAAVALLIPPGLAAAASVEPQAIDLRSLRARADVLRSRAQGPVEPLAVGQTKILDAVVMETRGACQWSPNGQAPWKNAEVDDILKPGAVIRTGGKSRLFLRVGHNTTLLVDRMTRVQLPQTIQEAATLRTRIALEHGIVDVKVDRVGPTNDVKVLTPTTTLAVEGTALSIRYGGLEGTAVAGTHTNEMFAMEVRYFLSRYTYYLSGGATSSDQHENPVIAALFETFGPPRILTPLLEDQTEPELMDDSFERNPLYVERRVEPRGPQPPPSGGGLPCPDDVYEVFNESDFAKAGDCAALAFEICENLFTVFNDYDDRMIDDFGGEPGIGFDFDGLNELFLEVDEICDDLSGADHDLAEITRTISNYCERQFRGAPQHIDTCKKNFRRAVRDLGRE